MKACDGECCGCQKSWRERWYGRLLCGPLKRLGIIVTAPIWIPLLLVAGLVIMLVDELVYKPIKWIITGKYENTFKSPGGEF